MVFRSSHRVLGGLTAVLSVLLALCLVPTAWAQHGSEGTVTVTVLDPSGSVVQGAQLELRDLATNDVRKGETQEKGTHAFVNLSLGKYKLSVSKTGFRTEVFNGVVVQAAQTTDISAALRVGAINETVEVTGGTAPLVETTTNAIGTTIDLKQIEDLPIEGRDLTQLSFLVPGSTFVAGAGTYDGLPAIGQGNNIDGVIGSPSRMKFGGNEAPIVSPRLESIEEMTVQTESLNLDQGFGQANMQLNFVTRRGGNAFHGRLYEDFRNSGLNANSWYNDALTSITPSNPATKNLVHLNDFGASIGGPIIKDKLFVFGSYAERKIPGAYTTTNDVFTPAAQAGNFTYNSETVNLFTLAQNYNASNPGANLPTGVLNCSASYCPGTVLAAAQAATASGQVAPSAGGDPNLNLLSWQVNNAQTSYFPAVRVDYSATQKMRFNLAWNMTKDSYPGANAPDFPGSAFAKTGAGNSDKSYTIGLGFTWTLSPTLVNEFRGGFLYNVSLNAYNAPPLSTASPQLAWNYPTDTSTQMSGTIFYSGINTEYPVFNASDTMTWQHGAHTMNYGFSWWREQDHYYNPSLGYPVAAFGLVNGDPATNAFTAANALPGASPNQLTEAEQLYAILTGRMSAVSGTYAFIPQQHAYVPQIGRYNLDELIGGEGLFFQDSYRMRPNFTINYGLRWDFTSEDKDLSNLYHSASPAAIYGPSGIGNLFNPGVFTSDPNGLNPMLTQNAHPYNAWNVSPQPAIGIAWNPSGNSFVGKMIGGDRTVIRAGYSLRKITEPQQYVWNQATDGASFYYQSFALSPNSNPNVAGTFTPGNLSITSFNPSASTVTSQFGIPYALSPAAYQTSEAVSDFTFGPSPGQLGSVNGLNPNIQQPYTQSWNLGIQRQIGQSSALEVRYVGSVSKRQWFNINPNEINIFGTTSALPQSFLTQFKNAQANLAANNASTANPSYAGSFAYHGLPGQTPTPIFASAFVGGNEANPPCADGSAADYCSGPFITDLQTGQAGTMAGALAGVQGNAPYFCNLVGSSFGPCANNEGFTGAGAGYPINYFQANPYAQSLNGPPSYTVAEGSSNYNAMQVDFRQRAWHGLQFDANYTWSHTLGIATQNNWLGQGAVFSLRDMRLTYGPTLFDLRHVVHINGTYDLPFGRGKQFANRSGALDRVVGGWTVGTIFTFQTGAPFLLFGGTSTFNDYGDGGLTLTGVTPSQLQSSIGKYPIAGTTNVAFINPKYLLPTGGANPTYIAPNTVPGTFGQRVWIHGPHNTYDDVSITKHFPITERLRFSLQAEMLNAFNHPTFGPGATNGGANFGWNAVQSSTFGLITGGSLNPYANSPNGGAREIELRANIEF
ncbi:MAG: carboxypeptidase-like regulatory domain-containing protein [Candidatus Sulfotelmatobacter sp.]